MQDFINKVIDKLKSQKSKINASDCKENKILTMQKNLVISNAIDIINETAVAYGIHSEKYEPKTQITNGDRIRAMSDEQLAEFLLSVNTAYAEPCMLEIEDCKYKNKEDSCKKCFLEYLQKECIGSTTHSEEDNDNLLTEDDMSILAECETEDELLKEAQIRASVNAKLTANDIINTNTSTGLMGVYHLGMKNMYNYMKRK